MTVISVGKPQELLALVPYQLGFNPRESAVLVSLRGARRAVGLIARVDLADLLDVDVGPCLAGTVVAKIRADGASGLVLIVYSDLPVSRRPDPGDRAWRIAEVVSDAALVAGIVPAGQRCAVADGASASRLIETWVVEPAGYAALGCQQDACCPPGGRPLADLQSTQVSAHMVFSGASIAAERTDFAGVGVAGRAERGRSQVAAANWRRTRVAASGEQLLAWRRRALDLWRTAVSSQSGLPTEENLGRLEAALDDILVRDAVLLSWVTGVDDLPEQMLLPVARSGTNDQAVAQALAKIVDPGVGIRPDPEVLDRVCALLIEIARHGGRSRAPVHTLLALAHWWRGDHLRAVAFVSAALAADESYRLARILERALDAGLPPGWVGGP